MANNLTGDFDVIAQFAVPAVNRVLAAMHQIERFQHSIAFRVDDTPRFGHDYELPTVVGVIDAFGDTVSDHAAIGHPRPVNLGDYASGSTVSAAVAALDAIANINIAGVQVEPIQPSNLKGTAQLQLFPTTIEINDASGTKLTVRIGLLSRYLPDQGTPRVAEFIRGDLSITAAINQVASQVGNVISIDVKASTAAISFHPQWSSSAISAEDLAGINLLIRNALRTSFLPSNATLPSQIGHIQFKTISGGNSAVAVLIDMDGAAGNPGSANQVFLGGTDGFAFGIGADYIREAFQPTLDKILEQQVDPVKFDIDSWFHTWHITYVITLNNASIDIQNGKMVLIIKGHAHTGTSWMPDFDFTLKQDMTIGVSGDSGYIVFGNMSVDTSSTVVNLFKSGAMASIANVRDRAMAASGAEATVSKMLSAEQNLGGFLRSLLTPARPTTPVPPLKFSLGYTSAEIRQTGIILHGNVGVPAWPPPRVEYEPITSTSGTGPGHAPPDAAVDEGPDYSALKTWIPGGSIDSYEWHRQGSSGYTDANRFVLLHQGPTSTMAMAGAAQAVSGYAPMCLTVHGTRLTPAGVITSQPVAGTVCGYRSWPVGGDLAISDGVLAPMMALTRSGPGGRVEVVGHAAAMRSSSVSPAPNMIVHFTDERSEQSITEIPKALHESGRADASTAILIVAKASRVSSLPFSDELTYAEDDGVWRRRYGVASGSATVIVNPDGKVVWRSEKPLDVRELASILGKVLAKTKPSKATMLRLNARVGQRAPNFLFEHAPGQQLTLRKLGGRSAVVVFFRNSSEPSVAAVREAIAAAGRKGSNDPVVLAVSDDGGSGKHDLAPAIMVDDRDGKIAAAYGVTMWPTIVTIDESGIVRSIAYGHLTRGEKARA